MTRKVLVSAMPCAASALATVAVRSPYDGSTLVGRRPRLQITLHPLRKTVKTLKHGRTPS